MKLSSINSKKRMGKALLATSTISIMFTLAGCNNEEKGLPRADAIPETDIQKQSYTLGHNFGSGLKAAEIEIDPAFLNAGLYDAQEGAQRLAQDEMQTTMLAIQQSAQEKMIAKQQAEMSANKEASMAYLEKNKSEEGVTTTDSGLQYKVITEGDGDKPEASDVVTVHYEGRLIDGTVFDSSLQRGEPATFPLNGVIPGWTEALQLMKVGSKYQLTIPPELGYGERGAGPKIKPNSTLIFDVELLSIGEDKPEVTEED